MPTIRFWCAAEGRGAHRYNQHAKFIDFELTRKEGILSGPDNKVKTLKIVTGPFLWRKILLLALKEQELLCYDVPLEAP